MTENNDMTCVDTFDSHKGNYLLNELNPKHTNQHQTNPPFEAHDINTEEILRLSLETALTIHTNERDEDGECEERFEDQLCEFVSFQPFQSYMHVSALAKHCLLLDTKEGKEVFMEAMRMPYMDSYFNISNQIENQGENTCGQTTLAVALNCLRIDPALPTWYGKFRWPHLGSLACSSQEEDKVNLTRDQFARLAVCNDVRAYPVTVTDAMSLDVFRDWVKFCTSRKDVLMVVNYARPSLGQDGFGHYSPIAGYHEGRDLVMIGEVAKHKYPLYWVDIGLLLEAMNTPDTSTGVNRGFVILCRPDYDPGQRLLGLTPLLRVNEKPDDVEPSLASFVSQWTTFLDNELSHDTRQDQIVAKSIHSLLSAIPSGQTTFSLMNLTLVAFRHDEHKGHHSIVARCKQPHDLQKCPYAAFVRGLQSVGFFKDVQHAVRKLAASEKKKILDLIDVPFSNIRQVLQWNKTKFALPMKAQMKVAPEAMKRVQGEFFMARNRLESTPSNEMDAHEAMPCPGYIQLLPEHMITFLMLSWPYLTHDGRYLQGDITLDALEEETRSSHESFHDIDHVLEQKLTQDPDLVEDVKRSMCECFDDLVRSSEIRCTQCPDLLEHTKANFNVSPINDGQRTVSMFLHQLVQSEMMKQKGVRRAFDESRILNRKLRVILNYYHLL